MIRSRSRVAFLVAIASAAFFAACGGDSAGTATPTATAPPANTPTATATATAPPTEVPTATPAPGGSTLLALLQRIPATEDSSKFVFANDYERARENYGVELPPATASPDEIERYARALSGAPKFNGLRPAEVSGMSATFDPVAWQLELGFTPLAIDADITAGSPPNQYQVLRGRFEPAVIAAAVGSDPKWSDALTQAAHEGVAYYSWGEDLAIDIKRVSATRRLGESIRVATDGEYFSWAKWTEGLTSMLDAGAGRAKSLADLGPFGAMAAAMSDAGVYTVLLSTDAAQFAAPSSAACGDGCLLAYDAFATAAGHNADGDFVVIVLAQQDEASAKENAARIEQRVSTGSSAVTQRAWSEYFTDTEIVVNGSLIVATLRTDKPRIAFDMVFTRDTLLLHE